MTLSSIYLKNLLTRARNGEASMGELLNAKKMIAENAGHLLIVVSPRYLSPEDNIYGMVQQLCNEHGVPFVCMVSDPVISRDISLWEDDGHLNHTGALMFTRAIVPHIKKVLTENNKQ